MCNRSRVFTCGSSSVFCVNCKKICVPSVACPAASNIINPCQNCPVVHAAASAVVNFQFEYVAMYPLIYSVNVTASKNSLLLGVNMSAAGILRCGAFSSRKNVSLASISEIDQVGNRTSNALKNTFVPLLLSGLSPQTLYDIYCYTQDLTTFIMPLSVAVTTKTSSSTLCCRGIRFVTTFRTVSEVIDATSFPVFQLTLDAMPTAPVVVALSISSRLCAPVWNMGNSKFASQSALEPSSFSFDQSSTSLTGNFIVRGYQGCYTIAANAFGEESYVNSSIEVVVQNPKINPPLPPQLTAVTFSSDGSQLLFTFGSPVAQNATIFPCATLLSFSGANNVSPKNTPIIHFSFSFYIFSILW